MTTPADCETDAARLRESLATTLDADGALPDLAWRAAVATVPRHRFVPGFYLPADQGDGQGLTVWEPVTAELDYDRWLGAAYSDTTLITQFDADDPDWKHPAARQRLDQAAEALYGCGYTPTLAVADGLYGYWPEAPVDRIVAACSFRAVPPALLAQTRPGGKILLTLSGWLYGYARVLLTVSDADTAEGPLLGGTVSFMSARTHAPPVFGNPAHWTDDLPESGRAGRHSPERVNAATDEAFHLRFLAQTAVPHAQMITLDEVVHLVDVVTGSAATLTPRVGGWEVREAGPVKLWNEIETALDAYDAAGQPGPEKFRLHVEGGEQHLRHPQMPSLPLPRP